MERSGSRWSRVEADGIGGSQGWVEKGKGGHTMTSPPSYAAMSWSSVASPRHQRQCKVVGVEVEEVHGALGCWRGKSSTAAGAWTSVWGSHILSECNHPMNLTRYHNLPHLNLESRISSTLYSS